MVLALSNIGDSWRLNKRLYAQFIDDNDNDIIIHFGLKNGNTYVDHADKNKRLNYIKRHQVNESKLWEKPDNAASLSRWLLWGPHNNINDNINHFKNKFNI